jgi:hypothetical protein
MMRTILRGRLTWLVGGVALAMAAGVAAEALPGANDRARGDDPPAASLPLPAAPAAADASPTEAGADEGANDWAAGALSRPLFAADRRPDAAAAVPEAALPRLSGTIRLSDTALAMFQPISSDGSAKSVVVGEGADLAGWTITAITGDGVTLMRDGRIATLRLSYANLPVAPARLGLVPTRVLHDKRTSPFLQP